MRIKIWLPVLLILLAAIVYRLAAFTPELVSFSGPTMGTTYTVKFYTTEDYESSWRVKENIDELLLKVNKSMSTYDTQSELSLFNKSPSQQVTKISDELAFVIDKALLISTMTNGEYDVTIGPLVNLWGFGPGKLEDKVPSDASIMEAKRNVGYQFLSLQDGELVKSRDIYVDLSSIAKGYGVDVLAEFLDTKGITSYLVEVGGEIKAKGVKPDESPWRVAIESPAGGLNMAEKVLSLNNAAMATSGDYRNYFEKNGVRYSHTISPTTGKPITHRLASVSVIAETATMADGFSTAISVLGPELGYKFAQENGIAAYIIMKTDSGFESKYSDSFNAYLE